MPRGARVPPDTAEGRPGQDGPQENAAAPTIQVDADILLRAAELIADQGERERLAYDRGFADGRARACVQLAQLEEHRESAAWWREWSATLQRIIQNDTDASLRLNRVLAEIAADQKLMREARAKLCMKPWTLSPLEWCALRRVRLEDPGDAAREAA